MSPQTLAENIHAQRLEHFDPLCRTLGLSPQWSGPTDDYASASAASGYVCVHFENDRGLCSFSIGPASDERPLCAVEEMAARFPRIRLLPEGHQRLSLAEQSEFLRNNWSALQVMFSPEHIAETRRWRQAAVAEYMKKLAGGS